MLTETHQGIVCRDQRSAWPEPDGCRHSPWTPYLTALGARPLEIRVAITSTFSLALVIGSRIFEVPDQVLDALQR